MKTDDLVAYLRKMSPRVSPMFPVSAEAMLEAADLIESLIRERDIERGCNLANTVELARADETIGELKAQIAEAQCPKPSPYTLRDEFHAHLDECRQCRDQPFNLCLMGRSLLVATVNT